MGSNPFWNHIIFSSYFLAARYYRLKVYRYTIYWKVQEINIFEIKDQLVSPCWEQTTESLSQWGPIFSEIAIICNFMRYFLIYQCIIDWKFWKISCEIVELEKNIMATSERIWPHCGAPAWYKLWYTFACNLRISFICYFQRETQFSCYISRYQLDCFVFQS